MDTTWSMSVETHIIRMNRVDIERIDIDPGRASAFAR